MRAQAFQTSIARIGNERRCPRHGSKPGLLFKPDVAVLLPSHGQLGSPRARRALTFSPFFTRRPNWLHAYLPTEGEGAGGGTRLLPRHRRAKAGSGMRVQGENSTGSPCAIFAQQGKGRRNAAPLFI